MVSSTLLTALLVGAATHLSLAAPATSPIPRDATPTTLKSGQYWIRAVASRNFHKYLQTKPANLPGVAILDSYTTAGQFQITDGQLVNSIADPPLYMHVEEPADKANPPRTLATSFNTTKNTFGTFVFSGDAVTWSVPSINRQNLAAWLSARISSCSSIPGRTLIRPLVGVRTRRQVAIDNYGMPRSANIDQVHFYNAATANN